MYNIRNVMAHILLLATVDVAIMTKVRETGAKSCNLWIFKDLRETLAVPTEIHRDRSSAAEVHPANL